MTTVGKIEQGKDFNFFKRVTVTDTSFPATPQIIVNIKSVQSFSLLNEGSITIEYSFNGNTVHGDLRPGTPSAGIFFDFRPVGKVWLRVSSGSADLRFEAWSG